MNIGGLFGALTPVFFVLALGYLAGKRNAFDGDQSAGLSKLALYVCLARVSLCQHDRHSEGSSPAAGSSCSGADSFSRRAFRGCVAALANGEVAQRDGFHYLFVDARDLRHTGLWSCRSRTTFKPNQWGCRGTRGPGD